MRIGFVQTLPIHGQVERNLDAAQALIGAAGEADLLVLPELFACGYTHANREDLARLAEAEDGPTLQWAMNLSRRRKTALAGGFAWRKGENIYNAAFLVDGGRVVDLYAKVHLFDREKSIFDPGPGPFRVVRVRGVMVGLMICYDWQFPEVARTLALRGAQIILHPSNLVLPWGQQAMRTRCLENAVFAVTANRVGGEGDLVFTGKSQITGLKGDVLAQASGRGEEARVVEVDPQAALDKSVTQVNDRFQDRRPELYQL